MMAIIKSQKFSNSYFSLLSAVNAPVCLKCALCVRWHFIIKCILTFFLRVHSWSGTWWFDFATGQSSSVKQLLPLTQSLIKCTVSWLLVTLHKAEGTTSETGLFLEVFVLYCVVYGTKGLHCEVSKTVKTNKPVLSYLTEWTLEVVIAQSTL